MLIATLTICFHLFLLPGTEAQGTRSGGLATLARDIRTAYREEGPSYQRLIRRLTNTVSAALYNQEWHSAARSLVRQGFHLDESHGTDDEPSATVTLPGAVFRTESGVKHSLRIFATGWGKISENSPTIFQIKMLGIELEAVPRIPLKRFAERNPYRKGTVMDYFVHLPELRKESVGYPTLSRISIRYTGAHVPRSADYGPQPHYEPSIFELTADLERGPRDDTSGERIEFTAESLLDPWKSIVGDKPKPVAFTPIDGYRDSIKFDRFIVRSSWQSRGGSKESGGAITRRGWSYRDRHPQDLKIVYGPGDLRGLPAGTRSLRVQSANVEDRDLQLLTRLTNLTYLDISNFSTGGPEHWKETALSCLTSLRTLERLEIGGKYITDRAMSFVSRLPNLRELTLNNSRVTSAGIQTLTSLPKLESLNIPQNELIGATALKIIGGVKRLKRLDILAIGEYTDFDLASLAGLSHLEYLSLGGCKRVTSDGFRFLLRTPELSELSIDDMKLDDRVLNYISSCRNLRYLGLYDLTNLTDIRLSKLEILKRIDYLAIQSCPGVTRSGLVRLMKALPGSFTLERY